MLGAASVLAMHEADRPPKNTATICGGFRKQTCFLSSEEIFFCSSPGHKCYISCTFQSPLGPGHDCYTSSTLKSPLAFSTCQLQ